MFQCAIPVFDGLLPEPHNGRILRLLFTIAHWHALAKLRVHNDSTLGVMDSTTKLLGEKLREFKDKTCSAFETRELKREYNARIRRTAKSIAAKDPGKTVNALLTHNLTTTTSSMSEIVSSQNIIISSSPQVVMTARPSDTPNPPSTTAQLFEPLIAEGSNPLLSPPRAQVSVPTEQLGGKARRIKTLNLNTYKLHSLGDYTASIRKYGTSDSYTTELVGNMYAGQFPPG